MTVRSNSSLAKCASWMWVCATPKAQATTTAAEETRRSVDLLTSPANGRCGLADRRDLLPAGRQRALLGGGDRRDLGPPEPHRRSHRRGAEVGPEAEGA